MNQQICIRYSHWNRSNVLDFVAYASKILPGRILAQESSSPSRAARVRDSANSMSRPTGKEYGVVSRKNWRVHIVCGIVAQVMPCHVRGRLDGVLRHIQRFVAERVYCG